eukprot:COSAG01_NODE_6235_length_3776_cov_48.658961_6_plen_175_part_00
MSVVYTCARLVVNISQTYLPLYLLETLRMPRTTIATVPLVVYARPARTHARTHARTQAGRQAGRQPGSQARRAYAGGRIGGVGAGAAEPSHGGGGGGRYAAGLLASHLNPSINARLGRLGAYACGTCCAAAALAGAMPPPRRVLCVSQSLCQSISVFVNLCLVNLRGMGPAQPG